MQQSPLIASTNISHAFCHTRMVPHSICLEMQSLPLPRGARKVASKRDHALSSYWGTYYFKESSYSSVIWLQDAFPSEQLHCIYTRSHHPRSDNFSLQSTTEVPFTFNPSHLKHCWYELHSTQLHLISAPAVESKHDKDSRSKVKSNSGKGKGKANPSGIHLIKDKALNTLRQQVPSIKKSWRHGSFGQFQS